MARKIIHTSGFSANAIQKIIIATCDDGKVYSHILGNDEWVELPEVPQDDE